MALVRSMRSKITTGFGDQGFEFIYESDFAPAEAPDEHWAVAFKRSGGRIVLSADKNIAKIPHQIMAFKENGLICFFLESRWSSSTDGPYKVAHLMYWWPRIQAQIEQSKPKDCWWVPMPSSPGEFRKVEVPAHVQANARVKRAK